MSIVKPSPVFDFYHSILWIKDGILYSKYKPGIIIDLPVAKDISRDRKVVSDDTPIPLLNDITELLYIDPLARLYFFSPQGNKPITAWAIYTKNDILRFITNASILLDPPTVKMKVFSDKGKAVEWLQSLKIVSP